MLKVLIDADMFAFQACAAVEKETDWGNDIWTLHADLNEAKAYFIDKLNTAVERSLVHLKYAGEFEVIFCFSDAHNFRKKILPTYKANRIGKRKPVCYRGIVDWVEEKYKTYIIPNLEADDVMGILATHAKGKGKSIIISGDKDMKCIPTNIYNHMSDTFDTISEQEATYWHLYQTLVGDTADNYSGCPSIGAKTAEKLLADGKDTWETVVAQYVKKGLTEEDALTQARVAHILQNSDYDQKLKEPIKLWKP